MGKDELQIMSFKELEGKDREGQKLPDWAVTMTWEPSDDVDDDGVDKHGVLDGSDGDTVSYEVP